MSEPTITIDAAGKRRWERGTVFDTEWGYMRDCTKNRCPIPCADNGHVIYWDHKSVGCEPLFEEAQSPDGHVVTLVRRSVKAEYSYGEWQPSAPRRSFEQESA